MNTVPASSASVLLALLPVMAVGALSVGLGDAVVSQLGAVDVGRGALVGLRQLVPLVLVCAATAELLAALVAWGLGRDRTPKAAIAACLFALTLPHGTPLVAAALSMAFGWGVGREVFGSEERSFVHPAVLAHVFLAVSWPHAVVGTPWGGWGVASAAACGVGAAGLLGSRRLAWRVPFAMVVGAAVAFAAMAPVGMDTHGGRSFAGHFLLGNLTFGALFLAGQPAACPSTPSGQWVHGALVGALVMLLRLLGADGSDGVMSALLLGSIFAPLTDQAVHFRARRFLG